MAKHIQRIRMASTIASLVVAYVLVFWGRILMAANGTSQLPANGTSQTPAGLVNPLKSETLTKFLVKIIDVLLTFAIPIIVFFIMYGGFKLVTARGDTGQIEEGKKAITWAVIGGVVVLASKLIIQVIQATVTAL